MVSVPRLSSRPEFSSPAVCSSRAKLPAATRSVLPEHTRWPSCAMDRYQIYESIGSSTHSIVYKARERKTIRFVAVRSTDKSQRQKVVHEPHL